MTELIQGLAIPFIGTSAGAACVFLMKNQLNVKIEKILTGFAAGVMVAASIWSLLIPAMQQSSGLGKWSFVPAAVGFMLGTLFLMVLDEVIPHLHRFSESPEGPKSKLTRTTMMVLAVTLSVGIAIQNFPEGAIVSMPIAAEGQKKGKAFLAGAGSGAVEPVGAVITILLAELIIPALPYLLGFAAGAMMYVVVEELIPEMSQGKHSNMGTIAFSIGFLLMMALDVALG